jgi:NitT/TauT family transport system ATP-binding protein
MRQLAVKSLGFSYDGLRILEDISFETKAGELVAFLGPSGCGKTTLLRCVAGLLTPSVGSVESSDAKGLHGQCAFVFQRATLLPWLTAWENLTLPFLIQEKLVPEKEIIEQIKKLGLERFKEYLPSQLSVGMAQRVAFARALLADRKVLLLDEPFSALDELTKRDLALILSENVRSQELAALMVTHSIHDAAFLADRIVVLSDRPARIVDSFAVPVQKPRTWENQELLPYVARAREALEKKP